ncbi:unnamed protein product [Urochloa humidicola]
MELKTRLDLHADHRNQDLLEPNLTWDDKVVKILHMARCRELTEYNHKLGRSVPTRFCGFNIAFFDLDKESEGVPWKPIHKIPDRCFLADSVNVIAIKVAESDRKHPISVFGTVLARDQYDYRCVYLFRRGRDEPQVITSKDDALTLMGPYRALAVSDSMYFEFHLKIKGDGDGDGDEDLSKGYLEHCGFRHLQQPTTRLLPSCLSTVELVYTPVPFAVEASFAISILKGPSDLIRKVTAWTTGNEENEILVYNKEVAGYGCDGPVRGLVAVPLDEELALRICVSERCENDERDNCFKIVIGNEIDDCFVGLEPYELRVKMSWRGVMNRRGPSSWGRPNMWWRLGTDDLLLL